MCLSCGCGAPSDPHDDSRNITLLMLQGAAQAAGMSAGGALQNMVATFSEGETVRGQSQATLLTCDLVKSSEERRYTLGVAYPAMKADMARAADGYRDFVGPEVLETTAWSWMRDHRDINLFHKNGTSGHGTVVESYIYRGPDWVVESPVDGKPYTVRKGDWLLGSVWDIYGWALIKSGAINGWSPEGTARRSRPTPERLAQLRS